MSDQEVIVHSVVRLPSLSPPSSGKRKRSPLSRSPSPPPRRRRSPPRGPARDATTTLPDVDPQRARERERQLAERLRVQEAKSDQEAEKPKFDPKAEYEKLMNMRSGGTYIPPARLRALQAQITDKSSKEYQRMAWEALKKSINGLVNKVNTSNIKHIVPELFGENLIRGRGLYCRSIMKAQAASLPFTPIYAAMTAIVNTKLPQVGELLLGRLVVQFRKAFKRNDKAVCLSSTTFIAHLCNQQLAHEVLVIEILMLLLNKPTDDSVEIAVGLTREVGAHLEEMSPRANNAVFEQFRTILHEASIDKRVQYMIEVLFQVRKEKYKDNPSIKEELDLVEEEDQITHRTDLDDEIDTVDGVNVFKFDPNWEKHEALYARTKAEILGEGSDDDEGENEDEDESSDEEDEDKQEEKRLEIQDQSNTNLVNLRRTIYLTIMSSIDFEECCHKLMKIALPVGQEMELCSMVIECCSQERTYSKFYGLIGERFAKLNRLWTDLFEESFRTYYDTIHRYETNRLRNIAKFFGHMLASDALGWHVLSVIHLNEEETTASSRIFIKILFQDLSEIMGMKKLAERLKDPYLQDAYLGMFPKDNPRNTRFSINYFTSIGMGQITEDMREHLKAAVAQQQAALLEAAAAKATESDSETVSSRSSYSSYSSRSRSSRSRSYSVSRSRSRTPDRGRPRERSYTRSPSYSSRSRGASYDSYSTRSRSYSSQSRSRSQSQSRAPRRKSRGRGSYSRSPPPPPPPAKSKSSRARSYTLSRSRSRSYSPGRRSYTRSPAPSERGKGKQPERRRRQRHSRSLSSSRSRSPAPPPNRNRQDSRSPPPPRRRDSRSSPPRKRGRVYSRSPSNRRRSPVSWSPDRRRSNPGYGGRGRGGRSGADRWVGGGGGRYNDRAYGRYGRRGDRDGGDVRMENGGDVGAGGSGTRAAAAPLAKGRVRAADFL